MTREQWAALSPEEQRIKVAELCGWTECGVTAMAGNPVGKRAADDVGVRQVPDYLNDLNAMHEAEKLLAGSQPYRYRYWAGLVAVCGNHGRCHCGNCRYKTLSATAAQRAEAFVLTMEPGENSSEN